MYGEDVVVDFADANGFDLVVRAHQVVADGYEFFAERRMVRAKSAGHMLEVLSGGEVSR